MIRRAAIEDGDAVPGLGQGIVQQVDGSAVAGAPLLEGMRLHLQGTKRIRLAVWVGERRCRADAPCEVRYRGAGSV